MPTRRNPSDPRRPMPPAPPAAPAEKPVSAPAPEDVLEDEAGSAQAPEPPEPETPEADASADAATAVRRRRTPPFALGATLYPLDSESQGPEEWYRRDQAEDLSAMGDAGFSLARVLVSWRVIEPQVGQYDQDELARLADLVDAAHQNHINTIVCLFADDRHAELTEVAWAKKRDPRTDAYLLQRETDLVAQVVSALRNKPGVFGWQLANEAFCAGFASAEALEAWVRLVRDAIREVDPDRPIALGVDAETFFRATGIDARPAIDLCEFAVSHVTSAYRAYAAEGPVTSGPSTYLDAFLLRLAARGKPVLADDVGPLMLDGSAADEAAALRTALWSGLTNRASGVLLRRFRDMETERREPYFLDPFETLNGVVDSSGEPKPTLAEAARFLDVLSGADLRTFDATPERTAVLVPSERYEPLPNLAGLFDPRACLTAFIGAKEAHIPVTLAEDTVDFSDYSVLIVPSAFNLTKDTWSRLKTFVQGGGSLVLSYGGGDSPPVIRDLFGVESLGDAGTSGQLSCRVAQDGVLGALANFDARLDVPNYALLTASSATVVATDSSGSPLLTVKQTGQGRAVYIAVPLERAIAQGDPWATPAPVREMMRTVYGAVARAAGCGAPVGCSAPEVEVALFQGDVEDLLVLINHSPVTLDPQLETARRVESIFDLQASSMTRVASTRFNVRIGPNGAIGLRLAYS